MSTKRRALRMFLGLAPGPLNSLGDLVRKLRDIFSTDDAAPISSPRTCEPGPGELYFVQTDGTQAISGRKHTFTAQSTPVWGDQGFRGSVQIRAAGLAFADTINLSTWEECGIGWHSVDTIVDPSVMDHAIKTNPPAGRLDKEDGMKLVTGLETSVDYRMVLIARALGCFYLLDGELLAAEKIGASGGLYPSFSNLNGVGSNDNFEVFDLVENGYPDWGTEFGIATDQLSSPAKDETGEHTADVLAYIRDITVPTSGTMRVDLRRIA